MPYKDPVRRAEYLREYKRQRRGRWAARQQALDAAKHANERAARYGCVGTLTIDEAAAILTSGGCHYCGSTKRLGLDHVIPLAGGGRNRPDNIVPACHPCNVSKWRQDRPWRWSRKHDSCVTCGGTDCKHICHGQCSRCHRRDRARRERASRRALFGDSA